MEMKLELVPIPVIDVDRAIEFYTEKLGFNLDHDRRASETVRIVQLTPPGSACSILISTGLPDISDMKAGSTKGLHLVVANIHKSHKTFIEHGVEIDDIVDMGGMKYAGFRDPDGNTWTLQQIPSSR